MIVFEGNEQQAVGEKTDDTKPAIPVQTLDLCSKNMMKSIAEKKAEIDWVWLALEDRHNRPASLDCYAQGNL